MGSPTRRCAIISRVVDAEGIVEPVFDERVRHHQILRKEHDARPDRSAAKRMRRGHVDGSLVIADVRAPLRLQQIAPDDQLLHFRRAFVDAQRADLAIEASRPARPLPTPRPPHICTAASMTRCAPSVACQFRHRRFARDGFALIAQPGGAIGRAARAASIVSRHLARAWPASAGNRRASCRTCARVVARVRAPSSSARRAKPSAAAATEVRKTSSVRIASLKPSPARAEQLRFAERGSRRSADARADAARSRRCVRRS